MNNIQVLTLSIESVKSDLLERKIQKIAVDKNIIQNYIGSHSVLIDDRTLPIISFYEKAFISARIKIEFKKHQIDISEVFFRHDFEQLGKDAYQFFLEREFQKNNVLKHNKMYA